ncbi:hypothetical protein C8Q74DRAFT_1368666 [Fomes fomentarius]|nr:hypothetical protein C8Q74DRAFT_1368666 [Fomes fomentarius]
MSSSELSNALNPHVVAQRPRRRHAHACTPVITPAIPPAIVPQQVIRHRSELELAIAPSLPEPASTLAPSPPGPVPTQIAQGIPPSQPPRNVAPVVQQLYRVVASARDAAAAERMRRIAWEREQEAKNTQMQTEMERQLLDMRQELSMLKAYISMAPNMLPAPAEGPSQHVVDSIYSTARIDPVSPVPELSMPPTSPMSPTPHHSAEQILFIEGSSSRPLTSPRSHATSPMAYPPTPQSHSISPSPVPPTPAPETSTRKRPRMVLEDGSDYDSDTEDESDTPPTDRPLRRRNGHDARCLTIHHAFHIHIRKMMKLHYGQDLPESAFEGISITPIEPVRFVWAKTTKQSAVNAAMKKRIISDLKAHRHKYKHVPEKDFAKKSLEAAFEQVFTSLRQKFKAQRDSTAATRLQRREDQKAFKARRLHRKKAVSTSRPPSPIQLCCSAHSTDRASFSTAKQKLGNRKEARKKLDAFAQPIFDGALQQECMSSEESDGEQITTNGATTVEVFRTRGLPWRSARLRRFYAVLDEQDRFEKSAKPKRGVGRRVRREGLPKDGLFLPPKGVARWMVSRKWRQEAEAMRPDLVDVLRDLIVDPVEPEPEVAQMMLGPEDSEGEDQNQAPAATRFYAHVSDTSYSLYNALEPV